MSETHNLSTWKTKFEQAERELLTWKARAKKAEQNLADIKARTTINSIERLVKNCCSICGHDTTEDGCAFFGQALEAEKHNSREWEGDVKSIAEQFGIKITTDNHECVDQEIIDQIGDLRAERDNLKARCEKLEGYVVHICGCPLNAKSESYGQSKFCTCGLDEPRKQGEEG